MRGPSPWITLAVLPVLACGTPTDGDGDGTTDAMQTSTSGETNNPTVADDGDSSGTTSPPTTTDGSSDEMGDTGETGETGDTGEDDTTSDTGDRNCIEVEVQEWIGLGEGDNAIIGLTIPQIGDLGRNNDLVQLELYDAPPPLDTPIDLSMAPSDNYGTCGQCLRLLEDVVGTNIPKQYFVDRGTLTFTGLGFAGEMEGDFNDVRFIEVTIDGAFNSTPVEGGDCIVINGQSDFDTIPG